VSNKITVQLKTSKVNQAAKIKLLNFNTDDYTVLRFFVSLHFRTTADFTIFISRIFGCNRKKIKFVFQHVCASFVFVRVIVCVCVRVRLSVSLRVIF
jgi:hypothetical protein